ncbi:MAG: NAD(P)-binding domain-containing protein, partial [Planctomycetes bacterium]|nr:NAD(P)-binding domain-containing protein [Planctomycetota bacterium]
MSLLEGKKLGIIGAGNMAEALLKGLLSSGMIPAGSVVASDPSEERRKYFASFGVNVTEDNNGPAACDVLLIAVKPQMLNAVLSTVSSQVKPGTIVVSIAAGVTLARLEGLLPEGVKLVRVMPNTPMLVGAGVSCLCRSGNVDDSDMDIALAMCRSAGEAYEVEE